MQVFTFETEPMSSWCESGPQSFSHRQRGCGPGLYTAQYYCAHKLLVQVALARDLLDLSDSPQSSSSQSASPANFGELRAGASGDLPLR